MAYSTVQYGTVQYSTVQYRTVLYCTVTCTVLHCILPHCTQLKCHSGQVQTKIKHDIKLLISKGSCIYIRTRYSGPYGVRLLLLTPVEGWGLLGKFYYKLANFVIKCEF